METAKLIKSLRTKKKMTQKELATELGLNGPMGSQLISNIERGICHPPFKRVKDFASVFAISPKEIFKAMLEDDKSSLEKKYKGLI